MLPPRSLSVERWTLDVGRSSETLNVQRSTLNAQRQTTQGLLSLLAAILALVGCDSKETSPPANGGASISTPSSPAPTTAPPDPWFREVAAGSGITFRHASGFRGQHCMPEINTGGVGLLDFDNDGLLDVFCVTGGSVHPDVPNPPGHRLFRNLGNWHFEDVTARAGVGANTQYGMGVACGDFDGDGWTDIYLLNLGINILYRNLGDGRFVDVTRPAGVGDPGWSSSAAFVDYDGDAHLDLFVTHYIHWSLATEIPCASRGGAPDYCSPMSYRAPSRSRLFRNLGNGTFRDVSEELGLGGALGNGLGVATGDFDHDGRIDVFVANDAMPNHLWMQQPDGRFRDEALARGCAVNVMGLPRAGMGAVAIDLFQRGWLDLFVTHLVGEGNGFFRNTNGLFVDTITPRGPMTGSWPSTGFGVGFRDFDHDGNPDLFIANGRARLGTTDLDSKDPYAEPNTLLRGLGAGEFAEILPAGGTSPLLLATSRGAAFGDLDNDGAEDVVVLNRDGPVHVLRNLVGGRGHWIGLDVRTATGAVARNATVRVDTASGRTQWRQVQPNEGYASSNDPRLVFGLGGETNVTRIIVRHPNGNETSMGPLPADRYHRIPSATTTPGTASPDEER